MTSPPIPTATAAEFLEALSLRGARFADDPRARRLVFRGHEDAAFALVPRFFRRFGTTDPTTHVWTAPPPIAGWVNVVRTEMEMFRVFVELADRNGLTLPEGLNQLRSKLRWLPQSNPLNDITRSFETWPPADAMPLLAIAQHYHVPTRLLDWSFNPLVAAYFAAYDAASRLTKELEVERRESHGTGRVIHDPFTMCVWGLRLPANEVQVDLTPDGPDGPHSPLFRVVMVPGDTNANLRAQQGILLAFMNWFEEDLDPLRRVTARRLRMFTLQQAVATGTLTPALELQCVTLKAECAGDVLRLLALEGIDGSTLFPGFDGIRRAIEERDLWEIGSAVAKRPQLARAL